MSADREAEALRRKKRLAETLKENLKRRKAQQRERAAPASPPEKPERSQDGSH
jgi:hypothetical protein